MAEQWDVAGLADQFWENGSTDRDEFVCALTIAEYIALTQAVAQEIKVHEMALSRFNNLRDSLRLTTARLMGGK